MAAGLRHSLIAATCLPQILRKLLLSAGVQGTAERTLEKDQARLVNPEPRKAIRRMAS